MHILVILGTGREGRESKKVADFVFEKTTEAGFAAELIDVLDYPFAFTDAPHEKKEELGEKITRADGYIIVSPEYNAGYPGELKLLLDAYYPEWARKPVGLVGVSERITAGARVVEMLKLTTLALKMVPLPTSMHFQKITEDFTNGTPNNPKTHEVMGRLLEELKEYASLLGQLR